jgi:hypothetical protein
MTRIFLLLISILTISACSGKIQRTEQDYHPQTSEERLENDMKSIVTKSDEPIVIFGGKKNSGENGGGSGMSNTYIWKSALESISFMPLASVDAHSGVILTDWYSSPETPNEKFKFNILVLGPELQISSLKVTAFRQVQSVSGQWRPASVSKDLARNMEDTILKRAISMKAKAGS